MFQVACVVLWQVVLIGKLHAQLGVASFAKKSERIVIIYCISENETVKHGPL